MAVPFSLVLGHRTPSVGQRTPRVGQRTSGLGTPISPKGHRPTPGVRWPMGHTNRTPHWWLPAAEHGRAVRVNSAQSSVEASVDGIVPTPGRPSSHENGSHEIRVSRRDAKQRTRRADRVPSAALPVTQRLGADTHHGRELTASLMKQPPNVAYFHGFKFPPISRPQAMPGHTLPQFTR